LAGQHWEYVAKQLDNFKSGKRQSTALKDMAAKLTPDEMVALGRFFEKQTVVADAPKDTALAAVGSYIYQNGNKYSGVPACASCHDPSALGTTNLLRLAGQYAFYIETQLKLFNQRERTNDNAVIHSIVVKMMPLEMAAVAEYLSGK
jgi:cytochrome c553